MHCFQKVLRQSCVDSVIGLFRAAESIKRTSFDIELGNRIIREAEVLVSIPESQRFFSKNCLNVSDPMQRFSHKMQEAHLFTYVLLTFEISKDRCLKMVQGITRPKFSARHIYGHCPTC